MRYFLTTARLGFRHWVSEDLPLAEELWGDPQVTRFLGGPFSGAWAASRLESEMALQRAHGIQYWPIFLLASGAHVGCCGLRPYDQEHCVPELGYHLRPQFWGQGLAAEAAGAVIDHAFENLELHALFAGHLPENQRSGRVLLKLGFQYQGMKVYPPSGVLEPAYMLRRGGLEAG
jgi:[ribosomal protein S5]-alanine N-acetyltransferase